MQTFEAWARPSDGTPLLDHTFVYCRQTEEYFLCWGGGNLGEPTALKIGNYSTEGNVAQVARCYRRRVGKFPDTAGIGIYGLNGVCHQSANCFLYPAGGLLEMSGDRPKGLAVSVAAYGHYGCDAPYIGTTGHWRRWLREVFEPCHPGDRALDPSLTGAGQFAAIAEQAYSADSPSRRLSAEFEWFVRKQLGEVTRGIVNAHTAYAEEHVSMLTRLHPAGPTITLDAAQRINDLSAAFQKSLSAVLSADQYDRLTGLKPSQQVPIVDLDIVGRAIAN